MTSTSNSTPNTEPASLPRVLGPWLATAILVGCVIGTGVFKKASRIAVYAPESGLAILAWVVVGLLTLFGAMTLAEVASLFPKAGGNYIFLREAYGRLFGFLWGWVEFWFLRVASCAALSQIFAESFHNILQYLYDTKEPVLGFWSLQSISATVVLLLGLLAMRGTKLGATVSFVVTTIKIGSIFMIILLPIIVVFFVSKPAYPPTWSNYQPLWPTVINIATISGFAVAMVQVMWPYNGWSNVAAIAGEIKNPQRNVPIAFVGGLILLIVIYSSANFAYFSVLPAQDMKALDGVPVASEVCRRLLGPIGMLLASAAIMISVFGAISGNMLVGPRGIFALSQDGLAPSVFSRIHSKFQTPHWATLLMTSSTILFIFAVSIYFTFFQDKAASPKPPFDLITDFITFGATAFESLAVGSIFIFRKRYPEEVAKLPYRCVGYPVVPIVFIACMVAVLANRFFEPDQRNEAFIGMGFILAGTIMYLFIRRK